MDGRYEIIDLPAGRYALRVVRSGYLPLSYGQRRPLEQGKPLQVLDKQAVDNIDFALPRASFIKGQIVDELSEPVADVPVAGAGSLVGDESVSGGPVVEVEEFAFDELPALDEAAKADEHLPAGKQTLVKDEYAGTDGPPSPHEESDE